jgi:hypothetical protein
MRWSIGSTWHRWDPHIHALGTLKENQYGPHDDAAVWERYFAKIREAQPKCSALGITDYFVPRSYRLFIECGGRAQLPELFVFPNVELRLKTLQDFVIAHELLHLRVPTYGRLFKALMSAHVPGWRELEEQRGASRTNRRGHG